MKLNKKQSGFSLLEIMIAVMVLAIGLLGMAAMQAVALSSNQEAQFRIQALAIVEDLSSRMRANRAYVNLSQYKYPAIPDNHVGYNVYSELNYNSAPANLVIPLPANTLVCDNPTGTIAELNCRATEDVQDIRRQLKPNNGAMSVASRTTGRQLPIGSLMYVDCADKANLDYNGNADTDLCSPGSVYTIYVFWPISSGRSEAGQTTAGGANRNSLNSRCQNKLTTNGLAVTNFGCVIMDIVP